MNIAVIDADLIGRKKHRFPNLACMKISTFYKMGGANVRLLLDYDGIESYDRVFISRVFTDTPVPEEVLTLPNVEYGGTGFFYDAAPALPYEIEHSMPDYHLYDEFVERQKAAGVKDAELVYYTDYSIGFTTRGCIRGCSFCVNKNYKKCSKHSPVSEFLDPNRKYICLLDDNILACPNWKEIFAELNATGKRFQFKQGMDERLLTDEKCEVLFNSRWIGDYIFAFDNIRDKQIITEKLELMRKYTDKVPKFYTFTAYNHAEPDSYPEGFWGMDMAELFERISILLSYRAMPYVMRYKDYEVAPEPYRAMYVNVARWCNQPQFVKKKSFREFCEANQAAHKTKDSLCSAMKAMTEFEKLHPDIAAAYFDKKFGGMNDE